VAREIAAVTGQPLVHLDRLFWHSGWVRSPIDEWRRIVNGLVAADRWVIDGNYGGTIDLRLAAADTVVFLDVPRLRCVARVVKRAMLNRRRNRDDMTPGCRERLSWEFVPQWTAREAELEARKARSRTREEMNRERVAGPLAARSEVPGAGGG